jgi:hypothetical protein
MQDKAITAIVPHIGSRSLNLIALRHSINFSSGDRDSDSRNSDRTSLARAGNIDY